MDILTLILFLNATLLIFALAVVFKYALRRHKYGKILPGRKLRFIDILGNFSDASFKNRSRNGYPFIASLLQVVGGYTELFRKQKLFCGWLSFVPLVFLVKAEAVEELISGTKNMEKGWAYDLLHPWLGTGLLTSHGSKWKSRRKLLTPAFHFEILKDFLPVFNEQAQVLVNILEKETKKNFTDIELHMKLCSLDIISETTLGVRIGAQNDCESEYVKAVSRISETILERMVKIWYWPDFIFNFTKRGKTYQHDLRLLHNFTRSIITEKKMKLLNENIEASNSKRKALLDLLLEHNIQHKSLSEEDIREEVDTFAFEGHDTTAMGMSWALYLIGLNKDVQIKVHEELDRIFGDDTERSVTTEDIKDMEYLDRVLKESQRLYPSVPAIARKITEDVTICGYPLPKGSICIVLTYYLHRDPDVFPNPEKFDPDRFLPQNSLHRSSYAYVPFSAGPRNCIGQRFALMEEKTVLSTVLRNFEVTSLDERDLLPPVPALTLGSPMPIRIRIRPRKTK